MDIKAKIEISEPPERTVKILLHDLGFSENEWNDLTEEEQREILIEHIDGFDQPCWNLVSHETA